VIVSNKHSIKSEFEEVVLEIKFLEIRQNAIEILISSKNYNRFLAMNKSARS